MKRRLIVMRHAKSSWKSNATTDHARPLNKRGRADAPRVATELSSDGWWPDAVISSDSTRTRETWAHMLEAVGDEPEAVRFDRELYHAGLFEVHASAADWDNAWHTVLVLGHNPGWQALAAKLGGQWQEMTTANAVLLEGEGDSWIDAIEAPWRLVRWIRPRELS